MIVNPDLNKIRKIKMSDILRKDTALQYKRIRKLLRQPMPKDPEKNLYVRNIGILTTAGIVVVLFCLLMGWYN